MGGIKRPSQQISATLSVALRKIQRHYSRKNWAAIHVTRMARRRSSGFQRALASGSKSSFRMAALRDGVVSSANLSESGRLSAHGRDRPGELKCCPARNRTRCRMTGQIGNSVTVYWIKPQVDRTRWMPRATRPSRTLRARKYEGWESLAENYALPFCVVQPKLQGLRYSFVSHLRRLRVADDGFGLRVPGNLLLRSGRRCCRGGRRWPSDGRC